MLIEKIELFHVGMPLIAPFRTAYGVERVIETVLVAMSGDGALGWGEASALAFPSYSPEYAGGVFAVMKTLLAPALIGRRLDKARDLLRQFDFVKGNQFAKAGLEMAWWDLDAQLRGEPLCSQLGGKPRPVAVGADFGIKNSLDELLDDVRAAVEAGFQRTKLKIAHGWDVEVVRAVRLAFPEHTLHVDGNSGYSLDDLATFQALDELDLEMIEQPLANDDLVDHAVLQSQLQTPICLDESITSPRRAKQAIEMGACRYVNVKPPRVGGLLNAVEIHDLCVSTGTPCWVGSMLESAIGASHCLALATLPGFTYPADMFPLGVLFDEDVGAPAVELCGPGVARPAVSPGIGVRPAPARLAAQTISHAIL
jgi:O-succinylbenzoate synthase